MKRALLVMFGLALAIEAFALVTPLFMQWVIDHVLVTSDRELLLTLVIGFSPLLLIRAAVTAVRGWMLLTLGASLRVQALTNLFGHLIRLRRRSSMPGIWATSCPASAVRRPFCRRSPRRWSRPSWTG